MKLKVTSAVTHFGKHRNLVQSCCLDCIYKKYQKIRPDVFLLVNLRGKISDLGSGDEKKL